MLPLLPEKFSTAIILFMDYYMMRNEENRPKRHTKETMRIAHEAFTKLITFLKENIEQKSNWNLIKVHREMCHLVATWRAHGSSKEFNTELQEGSHTKTVKPKFERTSKQPGKADTQVLERYSRKRNIDSVFDCLRPQVIRNLRDSEVNGSNQDHDDHDVPGTWTDKSLMNDITIILQNRMRPATNLKVSAVGELGWIAGKVYSTSKRKNLSNNANVLDNNKNSKAMLIIDFAKSLEAIEPQRQTIL